MVDRKQQYKALIYGKSFRRRAFYFLIFFLAAMTIYDVTNLSMEYAGNPKQANMNMNFNETMTFPNITFCMTKRHAWSHFGLDVGDKAQMEKAEEWGGNIEGMLISDQQTGLANLTDRDTFMHAKWPQELVISAYQAIAILNAMERDSVAQQAIRDIKRFSKSGKKERQRTLIKNWLDAINARNVSFADLTTKTGLEVLRSSMRAFQRVSLGDEQFNTKMQISWISQKHLCFQPMFPDEKSFKPIEDQGDFFIMIVMHDPKQLQSKSGECISLDFHGRPTTMARNMEGKGRVKDGITEDLCPGMMHEVTVDIRAQYTMLENDEKATACRLYDDEESETEFDCRSRCRMEMIRQMCHCTPLTLQHLSDDKGLEQYPLCDYQKCDIEDNPSTNFTDQPCAQKCVPHCVQIRYSVNLDQQGGAKNPALTSVKLLWGAFEYLKLEQTYVWTLWTFIAAVGGSIGMWLGLSMLSLIQLITFLTERTAKKVTVKKKKTYTPGQGLGMGLPPSYQSSHQHPATPQQGVPTPARPDAAPKHSTDVRKASENAKTKAERENPSLNPFGGPVAVNIFQSPFPRDNKVQPTTLHAYNNRGTTNKEPVQNRAASPSDK